MNRGSTFALRAPSQKKLDFRHLEPPKVEEPDQNLEAKITECHIKKEVEKKFIAAEAAKRKQF